MKTCSFCGAIIYGGVTQTIDEATFTHLLIDCKHREEMRTLVDYIQEEIKRQINNKLENHLNQSHWNDTNG